MRVNQQKIMDLAINIKLQEHVPPMTPDRSNNPPMLPRPVPFPGLHRPLQQLTDWWLHRIHREPTWSQRILYAIARNITPFSIAEMGVGCGEELMAMAKGAFDAGVIQVASNGYDPEIEQPGCIEWTRSCFMAERMAYNLSHSSLDTYAACGFPLSFVDLFHLHLDHQIQGAIELAIKTLSPRGVIVITDVPGGMTLDIQPGEHGLDTVVWFEQDTGLARTALICRGHQVTD